MRLERERQLLGDIGGLELKGQEETSPTTIGCCEKAQEETMVAAIESSAMEVECGRSYVDDLFSGQEEKCQEAVIRLKGTLIGSNKQKRVIVEQGVVPRLIHILMEAKSSPSLKINVVFTLGSIAKGLDYHCKALIDAGVVPALLHCLNDNEPKLVEACLCCLKTVFQHPEAPVDMIYSDSSVVPHLIGLMTQSASNQISVATIFTNVCKKREHQDLLASHGLVTSLNMLLCSPCEDVQLPALQCLAFLVIGNEGVAGLAGASAYNHRSLLHQVVRLMDRNRSIEMQLAAARCVTYLYRCGMLEDTDDIITYKALPCVVRMTKKEQDVENRVLAAETLAYLIEASASLQRVAAISNHLLPSMASFLTWESSSDSNLNERRKDSSMSTSGGSSKDMRRAAFRVFASLGANDEEIRKRVIETEHLMPSLVVALEDPNPKLQMAAIGCLHSLSRSVQLLRTTFQDHPVWRPLMKMLNSASTPVEPMIVASSTLCNLLLEFSPSKESILDFGAIEMLCHLTHKFEPSLRLNGAWGLMNMSFQADQRIKVQIIKSLGSDQIFRLLSDQDINVVMKTLGLLRNLLSNKQHIDHIMTSYGKQIMQAVVLILESDNAPEVKEQALCILANIADGESAKQFIMSNEDVLKKVTSYMMHNNSKLQIAAVFCVQNLTRAEAEGSMERQGKLREIGVFRILQGLLSTTDTALFDKVKEALQQFP